MKRSPVVNHQMKTDVTLYKKILDNLDQGFCIIQMIFNENDVPIDYLFLEINAAFEEHTGLKDVVGSRIKDLNPSHEDYSFTIYGDTCSKQENC